MTDEWDININKKIKYNQTGLRIVPVNDYLAHLFKFNNRDILIVTDNIDSRYGLCYSIKNRCELGEWLGKFEYDSQTIYRTAIEPVYEDEVNDYNKLQEIKNELRKLLHCSDRTFRYIIRDLKKPSLFIDDGYKQYVKENDKQQAYDLISKLQLGYEFNK